MGVRDQDEIALHVWSDYVCPFCYLELPELERLKEELGDQLIVQWHAFELRPDPEPTLDPDGDYLHRTWNSSVYPMAQERGMTLKLPPVQPRSRNALEAAEFAKEAELFDGFHRKLFEAFFRDGLDIGNIEILADLGEQAGLDPRKLRKELHEGRYTERVLKDHARAREMGIAGVPAVIITKGDKSLIFSGAQPYEVLSQAVQQLKASESDA